MDSSDGGSPHHPDPVSDNTGAATLSRRRELAAVASLAADERTARVVLALGCGPGDEVAARLVAEHGAPTLVRHLADGALPNQTPTLAQWRDEVAGRLDLEAAVRLLQLTQGLKLATLIPGDPSWPVLAGALATHPLVLWTLGDASLLTRGQRVAVVGTRTPTSYGEHVSRDIAAGLADRDATVLVSGTHGAGTAAARGALVAGGPVIAVLQTGLDRTYPITNHDLYRQIPAGGGLLVTACPPEQIPGRAREKVRDHLIASLADAVVVTQAGHRSPETRIAHHARQLGIPVGAVPGPVTSVTSSGSNELLRQRVAHMVTHAADAMDLTATPDPDPAPAHAPATQVSGPAPGQARTGAAAPPDGEPGRGPSTSRPPQDPPLPPALIPL